MFSNSPEDMAAKWILQSGIQNVTNDAKTNGGFNGWLDVSTNSYPFIYSEITGYGMSSLVYLENKFGGGIFLERAKSAAGWITKNAMTQDGGILTKRYYSKEGADPRYSFEGGRVVAFDAGMVLYGLCNVALKTGDKKLAASCEKAADFLLGNMRINGGTFHAVWDTKTNEPLEEDDGKWSARPGSYHAKMALGLIAAGELTGNEEYEKAAVSVCDASMKYQQKDGRFITHGNATHLHPHCYSAEGLLFAGVRTGRNDFLEASASATSWAAGVQKQNGGIPFLFDGEKTVPYERTDVMAQALRLASIHSHAGRIKLIPARTERLRLRLLEFQEKNGSQAGGLRFGFDFDGSAKNHLNSWCTMFSMQALFMDSEYRKSGRIDASVIV